MAKLLNPMLSTSAMFNSGNSGMMKSKVGGMESQVLLSDPNIEKRERDKKKAKKETKKNFEDDEDHLILTNFLKDPNYREAKKQVVLF